MGLTPIAHLDFFWVSQLGMLLGTIVYVNAGTAAGGSRLARRRPVAGAARSRSRCSACCRSSAERSSTRLAARRVYAPLGSPRPRRFDHNLVVIGARLGGLVSAYIAAAVKAKVTLVERDRMGGDCLNTGCVPSKALIRSARLLAEIAQRRRLGIRTATAEFDFAEVMARVQQRDAAIEPHDSVERYTGARRRVHPRRRPRSTSPWTVEVTRPTARRAR